LFAGFLKSEVVLAGDATAEDVRARVGPVTVQATTGTAQLLDAVANDETIGLTPRTTEFAVLVEFGGLPDIRATEVMDQLMSGNVDGAARSATAANRRHASALGAHVDSVH